MGAESKSNLRGKVRITGDSLISISLVSTFTISIVTASYYIATVSTRSIANEKGLTAMSNERREHDYRVEDRMKFMENQISEIKQQIGKNGAKLDLLIDISSRQAKPKK